MSVCVTGAWVEDQRSGVGKYSYVNGDSYDGEWLSHVRHGQVGEVPYFCFTQDVCKSSDESKIFKWGLH